MSARDTVPVLVAKLADGGKGWRGVDAYMSGKTGAEVISSTLDGMNPRERAAQVGHLRRLRPKLARAVDHWALSADPRLGRLSADQWRAALDTFLVNMDYEGCALHAVRHTDTHHDHMHIAVCRVRADGSVTRDDQIYRRGHLAAVRAAERIGQRPLPRQAETLRAARKTDAAVRAARRAGRRGTMVSDPAKILAAAVRAGINRAATWEELRDRLTADGVEAKLVRKGALADGAIQGWKVRLAGAEEWAKASAIHRALSWSSVSRKLAANADAAQAAAASKHSAPAMSYSAGMSTMATERTPASVVIAKVEVSAPQTTPEALEFERALRARTTQQLNQLQRVLEELPRAEMSSDLLRFIQQLLERLLALVVRLLSAGTVHLLVRGGSRGVEAREHLSGAITAELERRAVHQPRAFLVIQREWVHVCERSAAAGAAMAQAPRSPRDMLVHARNTASQRVGLPALRNAHAAAIASLSALEDKDPGSGLVARIGGTAARHVKALTAARRTAAEAAAEVRAAQREAERYIVEHGLPQLQHDVASLGRDVTYWRRRLERLERELQAARAIEERQPEPAGEVPAEQDPDRAQSEKARHGGS